MILDVVYNHTAEGGADGPTLSFRGLDDRGYYQPRPATGADAYWDVTGCGNTVDAAQPARAAADPRLAALLGHRDARRRLPLRPGVGAGPHRSRRSTCAARFLTAIGQDPVLRHVKLIAEPWDASMDGYRVGEFPPPWVEWNDTFRDTMRDFWRGPPAAIRDVASRLAGLVGPVRRRRPLAVRLGQLRHRPRRLHAARPGRPTTASTTRPTARTTATAPTTTGRWNHGVEGETDDPEILALRRRQAAQPDGHAAASPAASR